MKLHIKESFLPTDKKFEDAVISCDGTLEDLADQLWRQYVNLDDAITATKLYYERGKGNRLLLSDIKTHIDANDIDDIIEDVYLMNNESWDRVSSHFGRV